MAKFYCENCGYSFRPKDKARQEPPKTCPYCNRSETLIREKTSAELLDEL